MQRLTLVFSVFFNERSPLLPLGTFKHFLFILFVDIIVILLLTLGVNNDQHL